MTKKIALLTLFGLLLALLSSSCSESEQADRTAGKLELSLGVMPTIEHLPIAIAIDKGITDSLGLHLDIVRFFSPNERDAALQTGSLDATISDYTGVLLQNIAELPTIIPIACPSRFVMVVAKGKGIRELSDLKGKKIALSSNTVIEYATARMLQAVGLELGDTQTVEVQKIPIRLELLKQGEIDAALLPEPFASMAMAMGLPSIADSESMQIHATGIATFCSMLEERADAMGLLRQAYDLGVAYMNSHPRTDWVHVLSREMNNMPIEQAMALPLPSFSPATLPAERDLEEAYAWLKSKGLVTHEIDPCQVIETLN